MKKRIMKAAIILFVAVMMSVSVLAESDLFYTEYTDELQNAVENLVLRERYTKRYIENYVLKEGEVYDESKVEYYPEQLCAVLFPITQEQYLEFLTAEDKKSVLDTFEIECWRYPVFYDGERLTGYMEALRYFEEPMDYDHPIYQNAAMGNPLKEYLVTLFNKTTLKEFWISKGIEGYEPVRVFRVDTVYLTVAEKDGEYYTIFINYNDEYGNYRNKYIDILSTTHADLLSKQVWKLTDVEAFFAAYNKTKEENPPINSQQNRGETENSTQTAGVAADQDEEKKPMNLWFLLPIGVAVLITTGTALLALKKRK